MINLSKPIAPNTNRLADYFGGRDLFAPEEQLTPEKAAELLAHASNMSQPELVQTIALMLTSTYALQRRFHRASRINEMSGLPNKSALKETLQKIIYGLQRAEREGVETARHAFGFGDLDGLKAVNDNLDHEAGDACIKAFGAQLSDAVRDDEYLFHLSGDEFGLILNDTTNNPNFISDATSRLQEDMIAAEFEWDGKVYPSKGTFGFIEITSQDTPESVMQKAERLMKALKDAKGQARYRALPLPIRIIGGEEANLAL